MQNGRFALKLFMFLAVTLFSSESMAQILVNMTLNSDATEAGPAGVGVVTTSDASVNISLDLNGEGPLEAQLYVCLTATGGTATSGLDYYPYNCEGFGAVAFNPGDPLTKTVALGVYNDTIPEDTETIQLGFGFLNYGCECSEPQPGPNNQVTVQIFDDDNTAEFSVYRTYDDSNPAVVNIQ